MASRWVEFMRGGRKPLVVLTISSSELAADEVVPMPTPPVPLGFRVMLTLLSLPAAAMFTAAPVADELKLK